MALLKGRRRGGHVTPIACTAGSIACADAGGHTQGACSGAEATAEQTSGPGRAPDAGAGWGHRATAPSSASSDDAPDGGGRQPTVIPGDHPSHFRACQWPTAEWAPWLLLLSGSTQAATLSLPPDSPGSFGDI